MNEDSDLAIEEVYKKWEIIRQVDHVLVCILKEGRELFTIRNCSTLGEAKTRIDEWWEWHGGYTE